MRFFCVRVLKLVKIYREGYMKEYVEVEKRFLRRRLMDFWRGHRRRSNRIKRCEVVGGYYKYIGLKVADIWLVKLDSYEVVRKVIYGV